MSEFTFNMCNRNHEVKIYPNDIVGSHDGLNSYLHIYVNFTFSLPKNIGFDILPVTAKLKYQNAGPLLSESVMAHGTSIVHDNGRLADTLNFPLTEKAIHYIEKKRDGDISLLLELKLHALIKSAFPPGATLNSTSTHGVDYIHNVIIPFNVQIPRSIWIEKVFNKLGYRNLKLIEIPLLHENIKEAYGDIIFEFEKAEAYFNSHDYNKCVAHCRATLDKLNKNLKSFRSKQKKYEEGFEWMATVSDETFKWLLELDMTTYQLTSETHHTGKKIDFKRHEAESIYLIILGLLNYIGHIKS